MDDFLGVMDSVFLGVASAFLGVASVFLGVASVFLGVASVFFGVASVFFGVASVFFDNTGDGFLGTSGGGPVRMDFGELSGDLPGFGGGAGGLDSTEHKHKEVATQSLNALLNIRLPPADNHPLTTCRQTLTHHLQTTTHSPPADNHPLTTCRQPPTHHLQTTTHSPPADNHPLTTCRQTPTNLQCSSPSNVYSSSWAWALAGQLVHRWWCFGIWQSWWGAACHHHQVW